MVQFPLKRMQICFGGHDHMDSSQDIILVMKLESFLTFPEVPWTFGLDIVIVQETRDKLCCSSSHVHSSVSIDMLIIYNPVYNSNVLFGLRLSHQKPVTIFSRFPS